MPCSPQPTTLLRLLRQTNVMHELLSLWKLGHKVISTPGQKWLLMHLNENKQQVVSENKITPTFRGNSVYYTIRVRALQNGQRATTLVSAGHFWTMQPKLAMWFHGVIVSTKSDRFCECTQRRKSCALERFHFKNPISKVCIFIPGYCVNQSAKSYSVCVPHWGCCSLNNPFCDRTHHGVDHERPKNTDLKLKQNTMVNKMMNTDSIQPWALP